MPPKACYAEFEDPDTGAALENEFFVAERLGMTVSRLRAECGAREYVQWLVYFGRQVQDAEVSRGGR